MRPLPETIENCERADESAAARSSDVAEKKIQVIALINESIKKERDADSASQPSAGSPEWMA